MRELGSDYELGLETDGGQKVVRARMETPHWRVTLTFPAGAENGDLASFKHRLAGGRGRL